MAPNVKHDLSSFHRPSPVVGTSCGVVPASPHCSSVHFGFDDRPLVGAFSAGPGTAASRGRDFLAPLVICPPPPPVFDFSQRTHAASIRGLWFVVKGLGLHSLEVWSTMRPQTKSVLYPVYTIMLARRAARPYMLAGRAGWMFVRSFERGIT